MLLPEQQMEVRFLGGRQLDGSFPASEDGPNGRNCVRGGTVL